MYIVGHSQRSTNLAKILKKKKKKNQHARHQLLFDIIMEALIFTI